jgi:hypothetical protein
MRGSTSPRMASAPMTMRDAAAARVPSHTGLDFGKSGARFSRSEASPS